MTGMFEPLDQALSATACPTLIQVGEALRPGSGAKAAWEQVSGRQKRRGGRLDALTQEDYRVLNGLFEHLGESGRDAQELLLSGAIASVERHLAAAEGRAAEADRLYVSLGLLTGLMLALIVI